LTVSSENSLSFVVSQRLVERRDAEDVDERLAGPLGDQLQGLPGKVAVLELDLLEDRDDLSRLSLLALDDVTDDLYVHRQTSSSSWKTLY